MNQTTVLPHPGLGTLQRLPREIREKIYEFTLFLGNAGPLKSRGNPDFPKQKRVKRNGAVILRVSKDLHDEAKVALYRVNEFGMHVERVENHEMNRSVNGDAGFRVRLYNTAKMGHRAWIDTIPFHVLSDMRFLNLQVGAPDGVYLEEVLPSLNSQRTNKRFGPERAEYKSLLQVVDECIEILDGCEMIQDLNISFMSAEEGNLQTGGMGSLVDKVVKGVRGVRNPFIKAYSLTSSSNVVHFMLGREYVAFIETIIRSKKGTGVPKYQGKYKWTFYDMAWKDISDQYDGQS